MTETLDRRTALAALASTLIPLGGALGQALGAGAGERILHAAPLAAKLFADASSEADLWAFDGRAAGPVLRIRHGDEFRIALRNDTPKPLSLHWHGVRGPSASDGVGGLSQPPVPPGATASYRFAPPDAGTFLIRPMVLGGGSGEPSGRGLAGLLIVEEREPPPVDADFALLVRDWLLDASGTLAPFGATGEAALAGRLGNRLAVEGADAPKRIELPPGSRLRLRIANGCNARIMRIRFDGTRAFVGGVDGQPTDTFEPLRASLPFAPGSRYDIFLDVPKEAGATSRITALIGPGVPLVEVVAAKAEPVERPAVTALAPNRLLPPEIKLQNALRKSVTLSGGASRGEGGAVMFTGDPKRIWTLNGASGATASPPLFSARRGQPVVLAITNTTGFVQPMHLHGHVFRLLHALDDGWEPYWLDTLQIAEGKTVQLSFLADNPGRWLLSSTVLERLDTGLWTWFEVS